jgi:hypothetical protein
MGRKRAQLAAEVAAAFAGPLSCSRLDLEPKDRPLAGLLLTLGTTEDDELAPVAIVRQAGRDLSTIGLLLFVAKDGPSVELLDLGDVGEMLRSIAARLSCAEELLVRLGLEPEGFAKPSVEGAP